MSTSAVLWKVSFYQPTLQFLVHNWDLNQEPTNSQADAAYCEFWDLINTFCVCFTKVLHPLWREYSPTQCYLCVVSFSFSRSDMPFLAQTHAFCEHSLHVKENMFDLVHAEAVWKIPFDLDNKRGKTISVNFSFGCGDFSSALGRFLLMSKYFRTVLQILLPLLFD